MSLVSQGYGRRGRVALLVPQENPTAEPELSVLLEPDVALMVTRMTSRSSAMQTRLSDYGANIDRWMATFGDAEFDAVAFACTGTSYIESEATALPTRWAGRSGRPAPFLSAAFCVGLALENLGARQLALVSPYPASLQAAAVSHWERKGYEVLAVETLAPPLGGHVIYHQSESAMRDAVTRALSARADAVIILGTGAPTLAALGDSERPVLSSALCLGWAAAGALAGGQNGAIVDWLSSSAPWRARLESRFPRAADAARVGA